MLTLRSLTLVDFGPFKGKQTINFSTDPGVTLIFGENGRGKTTILNSLRFALFGYIKPRSAQEISLLDTINIETRKEGHYETIVSLAFNHNSSNYELTRKILARPNIDEPVSDADLTQEVWLKRDGEVLSHKLSQDELQRIMPEQVSRFFLFDGELLQEYEELLSQESSMGDQIKEAIERILGVPILTNARQDLQLLHKQAQRQESRAATYDQRIQTLQAHLQAGIEEREQHEKIVNDKRKEKQEIEARRATIIIEMRKTERLRNLIDERDRVEFEILELKSKIIEWKTKLQEALSGSWKGMLAARLIDQKKSLQIEHEKLINTQAKQQAATSLLNLLHSSIHNNECEICGRPVDETSHQHISHRIGEINKIAKNEVSQKKLNQLRDALRVIDSLTAENRLDLVRELARNLETDRITLNDKIGRLDELKDLTKDVDATEIQQLTHDDHKLTKEIALLEQAIQKEQEELTGAVNRIQRIENELDRAGGPDLATERRQRELCSRLQDLFANGVSVYRDRLRAKVEKASTIIFQNLAADPDYTALGINNSYGLTIIHSSGQAVKVRSAGYEHIVALSLIGALQQNAPLQGPIIMDSPFGRLDNTHKENVIKTLPKMAEQSVLLLYESEINAQVARNLLAGKLRNEYRMRRISSFHTVITS